ncbi:MAG TPA: SGNH/GDSL hydrolase family protein [Xanthobacteraceae bacterium]
MRRINLFLKGNLDVRDSLHSLRLNGKLEWNGVNEIVRAQGRGVVVRVRHETWTRSDALLKAEGKVPDEVAHRALALTSFPALSQFSRATFETDADAIIFSIQADILNSLIRHKRDGYLLLYPGPLAHCSPADRDWLIKAFEPAPALDVEHSMANLAEIIERCRRDSDAPILFYNVSSIVMGDFVHCYSGLEETLSTRIKRFNLGLIDLSRATGVSIVDVDTIVASHGANRLKIDTLHLNAEGCRLVAEEVVRILADLGCL